MYLRAKIGGYCHLNLGEEATVVGSISALEPGDYIFTSYREHGHAIARGIAPGAVMAELFGKVDGCSRGRGGSMHMFDAGLHFMGGYAIVGAQMPVAAGVGLAIVKRGGHDAVLCYIGDGATNIGAFHEAMNLTKLWRLPVVYMIVNNQYGMGSRPETVSSVTELWKKALGYDMIAERVDGTDILAMRRATELAMQRARDDREPTLIEAISYRYRGHSMADPARYRTEDEVREWMQRDPIERFQLWLKQNGLTNDEEISSLEERVQRVVDEAVAFADASPFPEAGDLYDYVYADGQ
jgi:pyruvate dehydrogenase E1 component alpha subunit